MKKRSLKDYFIVGAKGFGMGSADVVPGVSGGTIAFVTGIYEELLNSIKSINLAAVKLLFSKGPLPFWKHINGNFLLAVFLGIAISVFSLAKGLGYLLDNYPVLLWAFFFGLILGSAWFVSKRIKTWNAVTAIMLLAGGAIAWYITSRTTISTPEELWFIFLTGAIAICAMILPGISGSFILLLMGKYRFIFGAIEKLDFKVIITFALGAFAGLLAFSHLLSWMFRKYHDQTVALLTGFMIGSLNKVWPWKTTLEYYQDRHGDYQPLIQENVLPGDYGVASPAEIVHMPDNLVDKPDYLLPAIGLAVVGFVIILVLERFGANES